MSSEAFGRHPQIQTSGGTFGTCPGQMALVRFENSFHVVLSDEFQSFDVDRDPSCVQSGGRGSCKIFHFDELNLLSSLEGRYYRFQTGDEVLSFLGLRDCEPGSIQSSFRDYMASDFQLAKGAEKHFFETVAQAQTEMALGELQKIVPVVFEYSSIDADHFAECASALTKALVKKGEDPSFAGSYPYAFIDFKKRLGVWGITPEILWTQMGHQLNTMAVAGTYHSAHSMAREEFVRDPKETREHRLVILDIVQKLEGFGPITLGRTQLKPTGKLEHLVTPIELAVTTSETDWNRLLHPTAALGVFPPTQSHNWLPRLSDQDRTHFGAPICFDLGDRQVALVAIRQISLSQTVVRIGAGCGVVAQSVAQKEWIEIAQKREAIRRIFLS